MRDWSKKSWPTCETWPPVRVAFLALMVELMCARTGDLLALDCLEKKFYRRTVDMCGAPSVVSGEGCVELQDAVLVAELDTAEHGVVDIGGVGGVAVSACDYTAVDTGAVAVPCFEGDLGDWLASSGVDNLHVESQRYTRVAVRDILTNVLTRHPCCRVRIYFARTICHIENSQYGPSVVSGWRMQEALPAKMTSSGLSGVTEAFE